MIHVHVCHVTSANSSFSTVDLSTHANEQPAIFVWNQRSRDLSLVKICGTDGCRYDVASANYSDFEHIQSPEDLTSEGSAKRGMVVLTKC